MYKLRIFFRQFENHQMLGTFAASYQRQQKGSIKSICCVFFQKSKFFFLVTDILYIKLPWRISAFISRVEAIVLAKVKFLSTN